MGLCRETGYDLKKTMKNDNVVKMLLNNHIFFLHYVDSYLKIITNELIVAICKLFSEK